MAILLTKEQKAYSVGSTSSYAYKFKLEVIENSTSVVENASNVTINFYGAMYSGWGFSGFKTPKATIKVDDVNKADKTVSKITSTNYVLLATITYDVKHENDGTKKINVVGEFNPNATDYSYLPRKTTISADVILSTIAQRTEITVSDTYIESNPTILLNKKNDNFTTTLQYQFNGQTDWTVIATKITDKTYYNGWNIPSSVYELIPNSTNILCKVQAITYSGEEQVGEIYETSFYAIASEEKCRPELSNLSITNSVDYSSLTGSSNKFIKYISKPKIIWSANAKNSATIRNQTINGNSCTSPYTAPSWLDSYIIGITDSRGFPNTHTYDSNNMEIVDYVPLTLVANAKRHLPTDGKIDISIKGNWFNGNFGIVDNEITAYYKYRIKGTDSWTTSNIESLTIQNNTYSYEATIENFDYQKSYEFVFYVNDKVSDVDSINSGTIVVPLGKPIFDWGKDDFNINGTLNINEKNIFSLMYPIGSVYISLYNANPSVLFGGTWTQLKDAFLLACGDVYSAGSTGGKTSIKLTEENLPSFEIPSKQLTGKFGEVFSGANNKTSGIVSRQDNSDRQYTSSDTNTNKWSEYSIDASHGHSYVGQAKEIDIMPKYKAVYVWIRTS